MRKLITLTVCFTTFTFSNVFSQTVNDLPIAGIDVEYIQVVGILVGMSNKITIQIDYGQENKVFNSKNAQVKDENGKLLVFNSIIGALNFLAEKGYEFVNA